mgnify:CR=1 FL=1
MTAPLRAKSAPGRASFDWADPFLLDDQLTEEEGEVPRFGSIVLDEAFDKADSRYTRNAMEVFREFGFHMILATPQKLLQTLEPYVGAITSVSNPDRDASRLANVVFSVDETEVAVPPHAESRA